MVHCCYCARTLLADLLVYRLTDFCSCLLFFIGKSKAWRAPTNVSFVVVVVVVVIVVCGCCPQPCNRLDLKLVNTLAVCLLLRNDHLFHSVVSFLLSEECSETVVLTHVEWSRQ